jgi:hypothetical protein
MTKTHRRASHADPLPFEEADGSAPEARHRRDRERVMEELSIRQDSAGYVYSGYRYARLDDAIGYALLMRSRMAPGDPASSVDGPSIAICEPHDPSDEDHVVMDTLDIHQEQGRYRFQQYRYDRLADAVAYARLATRAHTPEPPRGRLAAFLFGPRNLF